MRRLNLTYLNSISNKNILTIEDVLKDERLSKHLWMEFILNQGAVRSASKYLNKQKIKDALCMALSWYLAFRWLVPENKELERLYKNKLIIPYKIRGEIYRQNRRSFLKGILYARLC